MRLIVCLAVFAAAVLPATAVTTLPPVPDDPMQAARYTLENGLTVYLTRNAQSPRFYAEIAVRAGSKHDPAETTGLAHYLEHLLFKGTTRLGTMDYAAEEPLLKRIEELYELHRRTTDPEERAKVWEDIVATSQEASLHAVPNELDRIYKAWGGTAINAHTWHEETVYKVDLPANRLPHWAALESERFREPVYRLFQTELETVYEEWNRALDSKERLISEAVNALLFKVHPYGQQPTLGKPEHLKNPSLVNIGEYYRRYYVPNNMGIFISGDIDPQQAIEIIQEDFAGWKPGPQPEDPRFEEAALQGREFVQVQFEGEEFVLLAWRTAAHSASDGPALRVMDMVLDNAAAGLINLDLVQTQRVRAAGSYPSQHNDYGAQYLWGIPKEGQTLQEVEDLLREVIAKLQAGGFDEELLAAIITDFEKQQKAQLEDNTARVAWMRDAFIRGEEWAHAVQELDRLKTVTKDDVVRVAQEYFGDNYVAGYRIDAPHTVPSIEKPKLAKVSIDPTLESPFARELMQLPVEPIEPTFIAPEDYTKGELKPGITLYTTPNPVNDLFTLTIQVEKGTYHDDRLAIAARLFDKAGTESRTVEELKKAWYSLGTDLSVSAGDYMTTMSLYGLDHNLEASLALLLELLRTPTTDDDTLAQMKAILLEERADAMKDPGTIAAAVSQYNRYGDESYFLRQLPAENVLALTQEELFGAVQSLVGLQHYIFYVGTKSPADVKAALGEYSTWAAADTPPPPYPLLSFRTPEQSEILFYNRELAQATVRIEFGSVPYAETLMPQAELYNAYFAGGMAGIVFQELREARALAYSVGARYVTGAREKDQNYMVGVIQSQADKTPEAAEGFVQLIDELPVSPERFAVAKDSAIERYRTGKIDFRGILPAVRSWELLGLEPDPRKPRFEAVQKLGLDEVLAFQKELVAGHPKLISVVGDKKRIDMDALGKVGTIREIGPEQVFVDPPKAIEEAAEESAEDAGAAAE